MRSAALLLVVVGCLSACETTTSTVSEEDSEFNDPFEKFNRSMFALNRFGDKIFYKPVGKAYEKVIPNFARKGIGNFFENLAAPRSSLNNFLQGKPGRGFNELARFVFNSTLGVGGLFNIADAGGMERYNEDFSQTLAVWGVPEGPYLVIPIWGPRTVRSTVSLPVDIYTDLHPHIKDTGTRDRLWVLRVIDARVRLMKTEGLLMDDYDPYVGFRREYLEYRSHIIDDVSHDEEPTVDDDIIDFGDDE